MFWVNCCIWKHIFDFMGSCRSMKFLRGGSLRNVEPLQTPNLLPRPVPPLPTHPIPCFLFAPPPPPSFVSPGVLPVPPQAQEEGLGKVVFAVTLHSLKRKGRLCFVDDKYDREGRDGKAQKAACCCCPGPDIINRAQATQGASCRSRSISPGAPDMSPK